MLRHGGRTTRDVLDVELVPLAVSRRQFKVPNCTECDAVAQDENRFDPFDSLDPFDSPNIFVNANYERFRALDLSAAVTVASEGSDYWVPADVLSSNFDLDALVDRLLSVKPTILVSAGPASCVIVHRYGLRAKPGQRQVIVDVGSAIDERTKGQRTRQYQVPGTRNAELVCSW
jgi:hypothetical protein